MRLLRTVSLLMFSLGASMVWAAYPDRPVKVVMPFPPGGTVDVVSRLVCNEASEILGKPLVLDYRPGAAGMIASEAVARAQPDGYTVLVTTPNHTINPALRPKMPFNTEADFVPVSLIGNVSAARICSRTELVSVISDVEIRYWRSPFAMSPSAVPPFKTENMSSSNFGSCVVPTSAAALTM